MAKRFFYVCAGLFLLMLSYHLGATSAKAQVGGMIESAFLNTSTTPPFITYVSDRVVRFASVNTPCEGVPTGDPIPGMSRVVWASPGGGTGYYQVAILENGDVYVMPSPRAPWMTTGNLLCGPTPATLESFGAIKARYR